jgi:hypothetical protein
MGVKSFQLIFIVLFISLFTECNNIRSRPFTQCIGNFKYGWIHEMGDMEIMSLDRIEQIPDDSLTIFVSELLQIEGYRNRHIGAFYFYRYYYYIDQVEEKDLRAIVRVFGDSLSIRRYPNGLDK